MNTVSATSSISQVDALWTLFQHQPKNVRKAFVRKLEEDRETARQKQIVKESLTRALHEVELARQGKIQLDDARDLFKELL